MPKKTVPVFMSLNFCSEDSGFFWRSNLCLTDLLYLPFAFWPQICANVNFGNFGYLRNPGKKIRSATGPKPSGAKVTFPYPCQSHVRMWVRVGACAVRCFVSHGGPGSDGSLARVGALHVWQLAPGCVGRWVL